MDLELFQSEITRLTAAVDAPSHTPMMQEIWLRAAAETADPDAGFEIITAGGETAPTAFAAFRRARSGLARRLRLVGAEDLWLHSDVFYEDPTAARSLAENIIDRRLPASFGHVVAESAFIDALNAAAKGKGFVVASPVASAPFLHFDGAWSAPEEKLSKRHQGNLRRRRKRLNDCGAVTIQIINAKPHETDDLFDELVALEASGWKGRAGTALACDARSRAFFRCYSRLASEAGILRFSVMRLNGKAIAARIGVECEGSYWGFKSGYDESLKKFSPGVLLFIEVIRYAAAAGLNAYEFLGTMEPWISEWATGEHPKKRLRYYPYNVGGVMALLTDAIAAAVGRIKARIARPIKK